LVTTLAGLVGRAGSLDGLGTAAQFNYPSGVATDCYGNIYVADTANQTIRKITAQGSVTTFAGMVRNVGSADGLGANARFNGPDGIAVDPAGIIYVADRDNSTIRKISPEGLVTTIAGLAGARGSTDGAGADARFSVPSAIAVDMGENLYIADHNNATIRRITAEGVVTTLAGSVGKQVDNDGTYGNASFSYPSGLAVDTQGNLYVTDTYANTIRLIRTPGPQLPLLHMAVAQGQLLLSWPTSAIGFLLETRSALSPGSEWVPVTGEANVFGCNYVVSYPLDAPAAFFRLHRR